MSIISRPNYCIIRVSDRKILYEGQSLARAAYWLNPGTVYGTGSMKGLARNAAVMRVEEAKENARRWG